MSGKTIIFDDEQIKKSNFYGNKRPFIIDDIHVNKILISEKEPYGKKGSLKYFIGYSDNDVIRPLFIKFPQMIGFVKHFDGNKTITFKVIDKSISRYRKKLII